jgi:hypothetical protein
VPKISNAAADQLLVAITPAAPQIDQTDQEEAAPASRVVEFTNGSQSAPAPNPATKEFRQYRWNEPAEIHPAVA